MWKLRIYYHIDDLVDTKVFDSMAKLTRYLKKYESMLLDCSCSISFVEDYYG